MDNEKLIDNLPQGPWLSEEEIQAILSTDSDLEFDLDFDRIMAARRRKSIVRWLWTAGVAAAIVVAAMITPPQSTPPQPSPQGEGELFSPLTAEVAERAASASQPVTTHASVWNKPNQSSCAGTRLNPNSSVDIVPSSNKSNENSPSPVGEGRGGVVFDPCVSDILMEADLTFSHADRVCEGIIIAADCEFETEENYDDASVIYI